MIFLGDLWLVSTASDKDRGDSNVAGKQGRGSHGKLVTEVAAKGKLRRLEVTYLCPSSELNVVKRQQELEVGGQ